MNAENQDVSVEVAESMGLNAEEFARACDALGRTPNYAEVGVIGVMWSEHCSYKSSRLHLARLPSEGPRVVQGPGENAGAVDIGDGYCAVFKMESHNHPSFIEPFQGAATGVGGILRDVFTMGARPIAILNSLRFGAPEHERTPELLRGVVSGIAHYGNCIGVPTVGGEAQFDSSYNGNILVNAFALGIAKTDELFYGVASGVGNSILYVGAKTGRDGIHGATMASAQFEEDEGQRQLPTVQVGDPFMEKLLLEACLEIFAADCLEGVQDMGAAGLTSSSVEMAARAKTGVEIDLDCIPRRAKALTPYEMLLSESQERMLMVAKPGREEEVIAICEKWGLDVAVIGKVTESGRFVCKATAGYDPLEPGESLPDAQTVVDLPLDLLAEEAPKYERPQAEARAPKLAPAIEASQNLEDEILALVGSPNIGSRQWIWRQYDHIVRSGTVAGPGQADAAIVRAFCGEGPEALLKWLALSVDCNGRFVQLDPYIGAAMAVSECARNIAMVGGVPLGLTDCLNFGSPEVPETMWRFARAIDGIRDACLALEVPVVSGNVSLYNETDGKAILPTPTVAVVGQIAHPGHIVRTGFQKEGDVIAHLGAPSFGHLGGSEWQNLKLDGVFGPAPTLDLSQERTLQSLVRGLAQAKLLSSAHDLSDGGLAVGLAESAIAGDIGAQVKLPGGALIAAPLLFGEEPSRAIISFAPQHQELVASRAAAAGVPFDVLGKVGGANLEISKVSIPLSELQIRHRDALSAVAPENL